ncbi:hypothetical protein GCM10009415_48970 [Chitinophaga japonensis]
MENEGQVAENYFGGGYYYLNGLKLNAGIRVARLPLALQYLRQDYFYPAHAYNNTWQVRFDREGLLDNYRRQLKERLGVDDLVPKDQLLEEAKNRTNNAVKAAMDSMKQAYTIQYGEAMEGLDTVQDYVQQDVSGQFRSILSADYSQIIKEKEARLKQLLEKRGGSLKERQEASKLQKEIAAYYKLVDFYKRYQELRKQYDLSGLNKQLVQEQAERLRRYEKMMDDPESVKELAAKHLPQSGLEKFFMNVQKLNLGQQTVSLSPLSLNSYLHSGVSMEVLKDNKYLFLLVGKERDLNALYDRAVFSPLTQNDHTASGIRVGRGALDGNHTHLSLFSFKQSGALTEGRTFDMPSRSTLVLGLSNRFNIDESSSLQLEVSRSATVYDQAAYGSDTTGRKSALGRLFSNDNLGQSIALMLKYRGNFDKAGLNIGADVTYVAAGYYNPGSPFLARGTRQGMLSVRKSWWKRKLVLQLRGDLREYVYGNLTDRKWQHFSYLADARLKLPGGQQLSLKYQPVRGVQVMPGTRLLQNASDRVTVKLNLQRRVGQAFYRNMFNIAYSSSRYLLATQYTGVKTLTFTSLQSIAITGHLLYWNNTYNYARNPDGLAYLNSSYNTDAGFTWQLGKKWSASSALNYTSATGWYKQLGARQTLTAMVIRNLDLSFFIDVRTNIEQSAAYYNDLIRADWSLKYNF